MVRWVYNNNTDRRGVWHVGYDIVVKDNPEQVWEWDDYTRVRPAHKTLNASVNCGQVVIYQSELLYTEKKEVRDGRKYRIDRKQPLYLFDGDVPPGPVCSRCEKSLDADKSDQKDS